MNQCNLVCYLYGKKLEPQLLVLVLMYLSVCVSPGSLLLIKPTNS
jgi:hypothetical protein